MLNCACRLCTRSKEYQSAIEKIPESDREFWSKIYDDLNNAEADLDYYRAISDGSWPSSNELLEAAGFEL